MQSKGLGTLLLLLPFPWLGQGWQGSTSGSPSAAAAAAAFPPWWPLHEHHTPVSCRNPKGERECWTQCNRC